ncbi:MAG: YihY/virulence factor BrkB family protein [Flavobacteriales bacterium]|jgi:membrane protein|nr:YihY/virulence factor BrkB family protein [Flavobacteriales bacterium]
MKLKERLSFLVDWSKHLVLPGFSGMNLYDVAHFFIEGLEKGAITTRASSIAFNFFLALFPALIFFFTLIPYIPVDNFQEILLGLLGEVLPPSTNESAFKTITDIINHPRGGLLSFGFLMALYFSTNSINSLMEAFNSSYHISESRGMWKQRLIALGLTLMLSLMLIVAVALIVFTQFASNYFVDLGILKQSSITLMLIGKWIILLAFLFGGLSILFQYGPTKKTHWSLISPGSILATVFIIITSMGFGLYIDHFGQYNKLYGSIGTLIVILLWMYFNAIVMLIGFELNASIFSAKEHVKSSSFIDFFQKK